MHIAIDARIINSSTGRYVERLLHYLQQIDTVNTYTILVREKDKAYWKPSRDNFTVAVAEFDNYSFNEQIGFKKFLDKLGPDLVHFCMPQQPVLYRGKTVTTFHDLTLLNTYNSDKNWLVFHAKQFVGRFVFRRIARTSDHILVPTRFVFDALQKFAGIDDGKMSVTYEAAEPPAGNLQEYNHPFRHFIMYVGQQPDYKNIRRLAEAHQSLLATYPELGLILVGKKAKDTLANEAFFAKEGYKNILFTDFIPDEQRDWLYKHTDAYVFPSLMEGFGLPGLEAMAAGAPVVSSNATCLPEVYADAAHYFNPINPEDISRTINDVLSSPEFQKELTTKGTRRAAEFSWKRMAEQTHSAYLKALATNSSEQ